MKLLNLNEESPEFFYVFMNPGNDVVGRVLKHNFQLSKRLISASFQSFLVSPEKYIKGEFQYLPFIKNENSTPVPSPFVVHTIKNYALEYNLETYRMSYYPTFPSRLGALYAFADLDTCVKVSKKYGWDVKEIKKFKLFSGMQEAGQFMRIIKCNMEIVSFMRSLSYEINDAEFLNKLYFDYWHCLEGNVTDLKSNEIIHIENISEYLIDGILESCEFSDDDKFQLGLI